jgi:predicted house-cleaning noncanonical NTP pyrophosphatase (MazG superfamily)
MKTYNKLVRDRIPEIIEKTGKRCEIEMLNDEEYLKAIDAKLDEELAEYHKEQNLEELADLLEVIYAAALARGYSLEELENIRIRKAQERGAFDKRILLKVAKRFRFVEQTVEKFVRDDKDKLACI